MSSLLLEWAPLTAAFRLGTQGQNTSDFTRLESTSPHVEVTVPMPLCVDGSLLDSPDENEEERGERMALVMKMKPWGSIQSVPPGSPLFSRGLHLTTSEWIPWGAETTSRLSTIIGESSILQTASMPSIGEPCEDGGIESSVLRLKGAMAASSLRHIRSDPGAITLEAEVISRGSSRESREVGAGSIPMGLYINATGLAASSIEVEVSSLNSQKKASKGQNIQDLSKLFSSMQREASVTAECILTPHQKTAFAALYPAGPHSGASMAEVRPQAVWITTGRIDFPLNGVIQGKKEDTIQDQIKSSRRWLSHIIGELSKVVVLGEEVSCLVLGARGGILVGEELERYQSLYASYLEVKSLHMAIEALSETMRSKSSTPAGGLREAWSALHHSWKGLRLSKRPMIDVVGRELYEAMDLNKLMSEGEARLKDIEHRLGWMERSLEMDKKGDFLVQELRGSQLEVELACNHRQITGLHEAGSLFGKALNVTMGLLAGALSFQLMDRLTGQWSVLETSWGSGLKELVEAPLVWFLMNLFLWGVLSFAVLRHMEGKALFTAQWDNSKASRHGGEGGYARGLFTVRCDMLYQIINLESFERYLLNGITLIQDQLELQKGGITTRRVAYTDPDPIWSGDTSLDWGRNPATVELLIESNIDQKENGRLVSVTLWLESPPSGLETELTRQYRVRELLMEQLTRVGVLGTTNSSDGQSNQQVFMPRGSQGGKATPGTPASSAPAQVAPAIEAEFVVPPELAKRVF